MNRLQAILETVQSILEAGPAQARTANQKPRKTVVAPEMEQDWYRQGINPEWMFGAAADWGSSKRSKMRYSDAANNEFEREIERHMRNNPGISRERASSMASSSFTRGT